MIKRSRTVPAKLHFPLRRLALCLDCDVCFEIGPPTCQACGGESWTSLARFLDAAPEPLHRMFRSGRLARFDSARDADRKLARRLLVVARNRTKLFEYLKRAFAGVEAVEVVLDRRVVDRRTGAAARIPDRRERSGDRRRNALVEGQLRAMGWAIVMMDLASGRAKTGS